MRKSSPRKEKRRGRSRLDYSQGELAYLAKFFLAALIRRKWFGGLFEQKDQGALVRLVLGIFLAYRNGVITTKTEVQSFLEAVDGRTSNRYVKILVEKGLLTIAPSEIDRRVDLLCPTEALLDTAETELALLTWELSRLPWRLDEFEHSDADVQIIREWPSRIGYRPEFIGEPASDPDQPMRRTYAEGGQFYEHMVMKFSETIRLAPQNINAYLRRSIAHCEAGNYDQAIADATAAIALRPLAEAFGSRGEAYLKKADYDLALADMSEAIRLANSPFRTARYYHSRAQVFLASGDLSRAIRDYGEALRVLDPHSQHFIAKMHFERAHAYELQGKPTKARSDYQAVLKLNRLDLNREASEAIARLSPNSSARSRSVVKKK